MKSRYEAYFAAAFQQAAGTISDDRTPEIDLFFIHYRQATLNAICVLHSCLSCTGKVASLKIKAKELEERTYASFPQMTQLFDTQLAAINDLCPACNDRFCKTIFKQFYILHHPD